MSFLETIRRAKSYLEEQGRISLGALKLEFELDDTRLESLIDELVDVQRVALREGKTLVWIGSTSVASVSPGAVAAPGHEPASAAERRQITVMFCDLGTRPHTDR